MTDSTVYFRTGYTSKSFRRGLPGPNEDFNHHETMTAISVLCRILMSRNTNKRDPAIGGAALLIRDLPRWEAEDIDFYYWHFATQALYQYDGPVGPYWRKWSEPLKVVLTQNQNGEGCAAGSWTSDNERWGFDGGRVYAVAINSLTLSTYYGKPLIR